MLAIAAYKLLSITVATVNKSPAKAGLSLPKNKTKAIADILTIKLVNVKFKENQVLVWIYAIYIFLFKSIFLICFYKNYSYFLNALIIYKPLTVSEKKLNIGLLLIDSNLYNSLFAAI